MTYPTTLLPKSTNQEAAKVPPIVQKRHANQAFRLRLSIQGGLYSGFLLLGHFTTAYSQWLNFYAFVVFLLCLIIVSNSQITQALSNAVKTPSLRRFLTHIAVPTWTPVAVYGLGCLIG